MQADINAIPNAQRTTSIKTQEGIDPDPALG